MASRIVVRLIGSALEEYERLKETVRHEAERGKKGSEAQSLLRSVENKIGMLKQNYACGMQIRRRQIPCALMQRYSLPNLWKINLSSNWRMLYAVRAPAMDENCDAVVDVLEILDHKRYDKLFGYGKW